MTLKGALASMLLHQGKGQAFSLIDAVPEYRTPSLRDRICGYLSCRATQTLFVEPYMFVNFLC